jgi:hypothetical protein
MFYYKYNKYDSLIVSAYSDFRDVPLDTGIFGLICNGSIMIPYESLVELFGKGCVKVTLVWDVLDISDTTVIKCSDTIEIYMSFIAKSGKKVMEKMLIVPHSKISELLQMLELIKKDLVICDIDNNKVCKISNCVQYQYSDGKWNKYKNDANRKGTINFLLCDKTRSDMIRYGVCDTDAVTLMKSRFMHWTPNIRMIC